MRAIYSISRHVGENTGVTKFQTFLKTISGSVLMMVFLFYSNAVKGQVDVFPVETMGTAPSTTAITAHTFANSPALTFSAGGAAAPADVRNTSASTGYTGASGLGNIFFTGTAGDRGFAIEGIDASSYTGLELQFA
jgi:hypothetical protein